MTMRVVHRILSILACVVMLYLGITGTVIQGIDLANLVRGTPESDPAMIAANEGKFGNADYEAVTRADFSAPPLPRAFDAVAAFAAVLAGAHRQAPGAGQPQFVELRMVGGRPVGQVSFGKELKAVDPATGAALPSVEVKPAFPPPSFRQTIKEWHRMWSNPRSGVLGVYGDLLAGAALWVLIVTGLTMYFRLLKQRRKMKRRELFWFSGGKLRGWHRAISVASAVLLVWVAATGTWMAFEMTWHTFEPRDHPPAPAPLPDAEVMAIARATVAALAAQAPDVPVRVLRVREYWGMKQGVAVTGEYPTRQLVFDASTGRQVYLTNSRYPRGGFPTGIGVHQNVKRLHSGVLIGIWARLLDLFAGLGLIFLSVSGCVMYLEMWARRRRADRGSFFWAR